MRSPGTPASAVPSSPRASRWKVSTASVIAGWSARTTASHACPTRLTCRPQASASNATVAPASAATSPTRCSCSAVRSRSSTAPGVALEHASRVVVPSSAITPSFVRSRCSTASNWSGATPSTSRTGWNSAISSPRSAHRDATSLGTSGEPIRSLSNSSIASKPAPAAARQLVLEHAADRHRGDALAHQPVSSLKCADMRAASAGRPVKYSNAPTACCTAIPPPVSTRQPRAAGRRHQLGLEREVDDVADPEVGAQQLDRDRRAGVAVHARAGWR